MTTRHNNGHHFLVHCSRSELLGISRAIFEVCNDHFVSDRDFETRFGCSRSEMKKIGESIDLMLDQPSGDFDCVMAEADGMSVQAKCVSAYGDPVDMSTCEARAYAAKLCAEADKADRI